MSLHDHKLVGERVITEHGAGIVKEVVPVPTVDEEILYIDLGNGDTSKFWRKDIMIESEFKSSIDLEELDRVCAAEKQRADLNRLSDKFPNIKWRD